VRVGFQSPPLSPTHRSHWITEYHLSPPKNRDRILSGEYIDFAELPLAKGKTCSLSLPAPEGNIILVNAFDLLQ